MYSSPLPPSLPAALPISTFSTPIGVQAPNWPATTSEPAYFRDGPLPVPSCRKNSLATWSRCVVAGATTRLNSSHEATSQVGGSLKVDASHCSADGEPSTM